MENKWHELYLILSQKQYGNTKLRIIYRRLNYLMGKDPKAPLGKEQILLEIRTLLRQIKEREKTEGIDIYLMTIKCMVDETCFSVESLNEFLDDHNIPFIYIVTDQGNLYDGKFEKRSIVMKEKCLGKFGKVFISHSTIDKAFARALVRLLRDIGLKKEMIFCSSLDPYGVPCNNNICDYIRNEFVQNNPYVIFLLSHNYYDSPVSLNEMGAAWVVQSGYTSFLLPNFDFSDIKGTIDAARIGIKLNGDTEELRNRLIEIRDFLQDAYGLTRIDEREWNLQVNDFINTVQEL